MRLAAPVLAALILATPATATEWINCADAAGEASIDLLQGTLDVAGIVGLTLSTGDRVWASHVEYGPGDPVVVGQAFETVELLVVDVMDEALNARIAELRLFKAASETGATAYGGTLSIAGYGVWPVSCSGP